MLPLGTPGHILGTDNLGRDQLSRLLFAGQVSLGIAVVGGVLSIGIGLLLGVLTGYYGGVLDDFITWLIATLNSIPGLFLLLIVSAILRPGPTRAGHRAGAARLDVHDAPGARRNACRCASAISSSRREPSARPTCTSCSSHIIPNVISITVVNLAITIGDLILLESALSFLGVGIQPPTPTWGNMLSNAQSFFKTGGHLVIFPGLLIVITVLCLYVIGDGLRDALDPTLNGTN